MNETDAKQRAIDALLAKLRDALELELVEGLPAPVYNFNLEGWMLFRVKADRHNSRQSEYVAVRRETGEVRFLGYLGS